MRELVLEAARKYLRFVKTSGPRNVGGPCPFHKDGQEKKPSFYINTKNGLYFCHSCHASGTLSQFLKAMGESGEAVDLAFRMAKEAEPERENRLTEIARGEHFLNEAILGVFQFCPVNLVDAGFDEKLLQKLEVGFDREEQRIIFPIRDLYGKLVGITGRTVIDDYPRYKVYKSPDLIQYAGDDPETEARYRAYDIKNHNFLWNMHNVYPRAFYGDLDTIVIVEGYKACIWMLQQGIDNTIALQGSRMTQAQVDILCRTNATCMLFLDANSAGQEGTFRTAKQLIRNGMDVLVCSYPQDMDESTQPDDLNQEEILAVLDTAQPFHNWRQLPWNTHLNDEHHLASELRRMSRRGRRA